MPLSTLLTPTESDTVSAEEFNALMQDISEAISNTEIPAADLSSIPLIYSEDKTPKD